MVHESKYYLKHWIATVLVYQLDVPIACFGKCLQEVKGQLVSLVTNIHCLKLFTFTLNAFKTAQPCEKIRNVFLRA